MTTTFYSVKGGSGTTTVALAYARLLSLHLATEDPVSIWTSNSPDDLRSMAGTPAAAVWDACPGWVEPGDLAPGLWLNAAASSPVDVLDAGTNPTTDLPEGRKLLVLRGPCYCSLRSALASAIRPDGVVLVAEEDRSITRGDIEQALDVPILATVPVTPTVARALDSGLFVVRLPREMRGLKALIETGVSA